MSVDLTGEDIFTDPVVTMGDGDPVSMADGALLRQGFQALVDRDHYLKARIEEGLANGAGRIRKFTLPAAIKGIASPVDGDCALLTISGQVPRLFFFRSGAYLPSGDVSGLAYDSTTAVGVWVTELYHLEANNFRHRRRVLTMGDADVTVSVTDYDQVWIPNGVLTASTRTLTISDTGATNGSVFRVASGTASYYVTVEAGPNSLPVQLSLTNRSTVEFTFIDGVWRITGLGDQINS